MKIPVFDAQSLLFAWLLVRIVIPVVVGSSPISHPNKYKALKPVNCVYEQLKIPKTGIHSSST